MSENVRRLKKYRPWTFQARATEEVQHEADIRVLHNDLVPRGAAGCQDHLSGDAGERAGRCEDDGGTSRPRIPLAEVVRSDQSAVPAVGARCADRSGPVRDGDAANPGARRVALRNREWLRCAVPGTERDSAGRYGAF